MNQQQLPAGLLLIASFALVLIASIVGPPRLFQEPGSETRLAIIAGYPSRWIASNAFFALAGIAAAAGLVLFSLLLRGSVSAWANWLAATAYILGTAAWVYLMVDRAFNPGPYFNNYHFTTFTIALLWLLAGGLLFYGVLFLQAGYPTWLGTAMIACMALIGAAALLFPAQFYAGFPPQLFFLFTLAAGIVILRN